MGVMRTAEGRIAAEGLTTALTGMAGLDAACLTAGLDVRLTDLANASHSSSLSIQ